jgi:hypothetical protein
VAWSLITIESEWPENVRARFTILSHTELLHSAVVVWAYAGSQVDPPTMRQDMDNSASTLSRKGDLRLFRGNNAVLMTLFPDRLKEITPIWSGVSSVHKIVSALAGRPLPLLS